MVHHYTIGREEARDLTGLISTAGRRALERLPAVPRRRIDDLPYAAVALRRLLRITGVRRVVFSASGLREGWFMQRMPEAIRAQDPLLAAGRDYAVRLGRDPARGLHHSSQARRRRASLVCRAGASGLDRPAALFSGGSARAVVQRRC